MDHGPLAGTSLGIPTFHFCPDLIMETLNVLLYLTDNLEAEQPLHSREPVLSNQISFSFTPLTRL